jgi:hypothetical protein
MRRRDFVKALMAAPAAAKAALAQQAAAPSAPVAPAHAPVAAGPVPWMEGLTEMGPLPVTPLVPDAVARTAAHFFSEPQMATLRRLSQILLPPMKDRPGAVEAGTPEFLDFLIGASPAHRREIYTTGLDRLDSEARKRFGIAFAAVSEAQADQLIRPWLRTWMPDHPPAEGFAQFINLAHTDIRFATHNSQAWNDAEIAAGRPAPQAEVYWYPVDPGMHRESSAAARQAAPQKQRS